MILNERLLAITFARSSPVNDEGIMFVNLVKSLADSGTSKKRTIVDGGGAARIDSKCWSIESGGENISRWSCSA